MTDVKNDFFAKEKLSVKYKMLYGLAGVGDSTVYNLFGTFALFFLTTVAGIEPAVAGTITAIGAVWETACGAVIGYASDNTHTRFGRRKPFLLAASVPLFVFTSLFFAYPDLDGRVQVFYYGAMLVLFWTSFSTFFVPYLAWGAELTQDYDDRTILRGYTYCFNTVGMVLGVVVPNVIVDFLVDSGKSVTASWQMMAVFCGVVSGASVFIAAAGIRDRYERQYREDRKNGILPEKKAKPGKSVKERAYVVVDMLKNYAEIFRMRAVKYLLFASVSYLIAYAVFSAVRMYFFTYNMELTAGQISFVMLIMSFAAVAFVPLIAVVNRWWDKRTTFIGGMAISALGMGIYRLIGLDSMGDILIFSMFYCISSIVYWQLMPAMIYDACEVDQLMNDKNRAGLVISLQSLSESISNAGGLQLTGLILGLSGFVGTAAVQTDRALYWIELSFTVIPALFMALAMLMIIRYPVTKVMYNRVLEALERRKNGEEVDLSEFSRLK